MEKEAGGVLSRPYLINLCKWYLRPIFDHVLQPSRYPLDRRIAWIVERPTAYILNNEPFGAELYTTTIGGLFRVKVPPAGNTILAWQLSDCRYMRLFSYLTEFIYFTLYYYDLRIMAIQTVFFGVVDCFYFGAEYSKKYTACLCAVYIRLK